MFVTVNLNQQYQVGTVVSYNEQSKVYEVSNSAVYPFGVVLKTPVLDSESGLYSARVAFAGSCYALASDTIPAQGGILEVVQGKVRVSSVDTHSGVIAPLSIGEQERVANSLVLVHLR